MDSAAPRALVINLFPMTRLGGGETFVLNGLKSALAAGVRPTLAFPSRQLHDRQSLQPERWPPFVLPVVDGVVRSTCHQSWRELLESMNDYSLVWITQYLSNDLVFDVLRNVPSNRRLILTNHGHEPVRSLFESIYQDGSHHQFSEVSQAAAARVRCRRTHVRSVSAGVWENMIETPRWQPPVNGVLKVCSVGRQLPHKGIEHTIRALGPEDSLDVIGHAGHDLAYETFLQKEAVGRQVRFVGDADDAAMLALLRKSHCLVASSTTRFYNGVECEQAELLGLVLLEAVASGGLAVSSDIPAFREVMGRLRLEDFVYREGDAASLADVLERVRTLTETEALALVRGAQEGLRQHFLWNDYWARATGLIATAPHARIRAAA